MCFKLWMRLIFVWFEKHQKPTILRVDHRICDWNWNLTIVFCSLHLHLQLCQRFVAGQNQCEHIPWRRWFIKFAIERRCVDWLTGATAMDTLDIGMVQSRIVSYQLDQIEKCANYIGKNFVFLFCDFRCIWACLSTDIVFYCFKTELRRSKYHDRNMWVRTEWRRRDGWRWMAGANSTAGQI